MSFPAEGDGVKTSDLPYFNKYNLIDYDDTIQNEFAPHFFCLLWVVQITGYLTFLTLSGAVADWYFTARDENGKKKRGKADDQLPSSPTFQSFWRAVRYHLGSIMFAGLIIAIVQFIRVCVRYMERVMNGGKEPNKIQKIFMRVVDCLLWCLECCLDKISKNALIWISIYGDPFCPSAVSSFSLIWANLLRVAVISFFSTLVVLIGKIMVPVITVGACTFVIMNIEPYKSTVSSPVFPAVVIFILSFGIGNMFLSVYDTAIDTVFFCFLLDEKINGNTAMFADENLRSIVQEYEKESDALGKSLLNRSAVSKVPSEEKDPLKDEDINV